MSTNPITQDAELFGVGLLEFLVHLPEETPPDASIFLTGSGDLLGRWAANAIRLHRTSAREARISLPFPPGWEGQYLFTLGSWRAVEHDTHGRELAPRQLKPRPGTHQEVSVAGWGRRSIHYHDQVRSQFLELPRPVAVYLPPGYELETERRYSVLYMHDGQNLFDADKAFGGNPWAADDAAERCARNHTARPVILVGIGNTEQRMEEYGPPIGRGSHKNNLARRYGRFLVEELKPWIDATYRTTPDREHTGVAGSSMGGLISLCLAKWYPQVFGRCAALSPSLWWEDEYFLKTLHLKPAWLKHCRLWVDMGDRELNGKRSSLIAAKRIHKMEQILTNRGLQQGRDFFAKIYENAGHNETAWRLRFPEVLSFLFPLSGSHAA